MKSYYAATMDLYKEANQDEGSRQQPYQLML